MRLFPGPKSSIRQEPSVLDMAKILHFHMRRNWYSEIGKFLPFENFYLLKIANMALSVDNQMSKVFLFMIPIFEWKYFTFSIFAIIGENTSADSIVGYEIRQSSI
jgi:hypothetical protein